MYEVRFLQKVCEEEVPQNILVRKINTQIIYEQLCCYFANIMAEKLHLILTCISLIFLMNILHSLNEFTECYISKLQNVLTKVVNIQASPAGGKESDYNAGATGDADSIPGSGRSPGEEHGSPLQYSFLENPIDRGAWWASVHRAAKITLMHS